MKKCAYSECSNEFKSKTHNQRYCCDECCRLATNKRIMEKYYQRKARRKGGLRVCISEGCDTILNRYNDSDRCSGCASRRVADINSSLLRNVGYVTG